MALAASPARGADDPFALDPAPAHVPPGPPAASAAGNSGSSQSDYLFYAVVEVNGRELGRMVKMREQDGHLLIARASLSYVGLSDVPGTGGFVDLSTVAGLTFAMDWQHYRLSIAIGSLDNPKNVVNFKREAEARLAPIHPLPALFVNYDLSAQAGPGGLQLAGQITTRIARGNLAAESSWIFNTGDRGRGVIRLNSQLTIDDPEHLRSLTLGDFVQSSSADARAVRLGGVQLSRNFSLQPDFIAYPLPDFSGNLAVPQQLDLIVNDRRLATENLQAGTFSLLNVPASAGRGRVGVIVKDSLGREQYIGIDYYSSRQLLDPGVAQWSVDLGFVRRRFGLANNAYGPFAASAVLRQGINKHLTLGLSAEGGNGLRNFGGNAVITIGGLAELGFGIKVSHWAQSPLARSGSAATFNLASAGRPVSVRLSGRYVSPGYDDLASAGGDAPPNSFIALGIDFDLGKMGGLSLNLLRERDVRLGPQVSLLETRQVASVSYRTSVGRANLFADVSWRGFGGQRTATVFGGISMPFGGRTSASASVSRDRGAGSQYGLGVDHPAVVTGDVGFGLRAEAGRADLLRGSVSYLGPWGRIEAQAELVGGAAASRLGVQGTMILTEGGLYPARDSSSGMVLVDTGGASGVELSRENRVVARANKRGRILLTDLVPRTPMRIGIVPDTLPVGAVADRHSLVVAVPGGTVARVDLGIRLYRPVTVQLLDQRGQPFAPGTRVKTLPSGTETVVGFDSQVEINAASDDRQIVVQVDNATVCYAQISELDIAPRPGAHGPEPLRCFGRMRSFPIAGGGDVGARVPNGSSR